MSPLAAVLSVHGFTLSLMRAGSLGDTLSRVVATLTEDFHTDFVRMALFRPVDGFQPDWLRVAARDAGEWGLFAEFFGKGEPLCGRINADKIEFLFGQHALQVRSAVLIPIRNRGLLAIGSHDPNRFHPGMGTIFLKLIADAVDVALARFET